jgi:signal transduction histidine kinase
VPTRLNVTDDLFFSLVEHSDVGLIAFRQNGSGFDVVFVNQHARSMLECDPGQSLRIEDMFPDSDRGGSFRALDSNLILREGRTPEVVMRKSNQHIFIASLGVKHLVVNDQTTFLVSFRDLTIEKKLGRDLQAKQFELERAYAELLEHNAQLKQLDQAKDRFIALTTHELRTPLSAILATADVLELKLYESEAQRDEFIHTIGEQGRHLLTLVNDVLDFSKIRAGKMDFYVEKIDLKALILKMIGNFEHMALADNIKFDVNLEGSSAVAWADTLRMKEVFSNVLSNAVKYNRPGGCIFVRMSDVVSDDEKRYVRISVRDTGVGIPKDRLESVFNEFETVGHVSRHHKGTGLGMPISKRLLESMAGRLLLESEPGVGSEFFIDVPVDELLPAELYR